MGTGASRPLSIAVSPSTTNSSTITNNEPDENTNNNNNQTNSTPKSSNPSKTKVVRPVKRKSPQEIQKKLRKRKNKGQIWSNTYAQWSLLEVRSVPPGRYAHTTVAIERNLYVFGGYTGSYDDSLYILNLDTNEWHKAETQGQTPVGRAFHSAAAVGDVIYVFGGYNAGGLTSNDLYMLNTVDLTWTLVASNRHTPSARSEHSLVAEGSLLYLFAGSSSGFYANDLHIYDTVNSLWATTRDINDPSKRCAHSCSMKDGKMFIYGGFDGKHRFKDSCVFLKSLVRWEKNEVQYHSGHRAAHASAFIGNKMYVFGGWDGQKRLNDVGVLDTSIKGKWSRPHIKGNPPPGLSYHTATCVDNKIYVVGGWTGKDRVNEVFVLEEVMPTLADLCIGSIVQNPEVVGDLSVLPADLLDILEKNAVN